MPSSDYSNAVGGGLKLKGSSGGIDKKKKKKKSKPAEESEKKVEVQQPEQPAEEDSIEQTALQKALADEEGDRRDGKASEADVKEYGKTEAQRRFEERRKKRVSAHIFTYIEGDVWRKLTLRWLQLDERLKREGVQTHKERVQQLNKYLSTLSEHNDMPRIGPG